LLAAVVLFHLLLFLTAFLLLRPAGTTDEEVEGAPAAEDEVQGLRLLNSASPAQFLAWSDGMACHALEKRDFETNCVIPQSELVDSIVKCITEAGMESITSIGSGPALLEWLLAEHFPVRCVDTLYAGADPQVPNVSRCVAGAQGIAGSVTPRCALTFEAPPQAAQGPWGPLNGMGLQPLGVGWAPVKVHAKSALLWVWGKVDPGSARDYLLEYKQLGGCIIIIEAEKEYCMPSIADVAAILEVPGADASDAEQSNSRSPSSGWCVGPKGQCATVGRPCHYCVFSSVAV